MNNKTMILAASMLMLSAAVPVTAYHIVGNTVLGTPTLGSGDWAIDNGLLIICESDGPNDPRNPNPLTPLVGVGGLCTTGRNAVTGVAAPSGMPGVNDWTQLDICDLTTAARALVGGCTGIETIAFTAQIGVYSCFVPTTGTPLDALGFLSDTDFSLYYEELYAWWSYDGDGSAAQAGPGHHGHVSVFPELTERALGVNPLPTLPGAPPPGAPQPVTGSVYTAQQAPPTPLDDDDNSAAAGDFANSCGASPSNPPSGSPGPVVVAKSL